MKKLLLLSTFAFGLFTFSFSQQYGWTDISANMPESANLTDVHVIGNEIWIAGWNDGVFYSPDGGETFQIQPLPENSGITSSIFMKNNQEGYVVTFLGNILITLDGGTTWSTLYEPGGALNSVHFPPNSDTGYACGTNGTVYMFDDTNLTDISPPANASNLQSIFFPVNNADGKICGQTTIARYKNSTWNNLQFYNSTLFYNSIFFVNDITGWCVGINGTIILTSDGFSWVLQASNTTKNLNDVFFINPFEGWAVGTEVLLHTIDGGETWTQELASQTVGMELSALYFTDPNNGYVVGNYTVLKYEEVSGIEDGVKTFPFEIFPNPARNEFIVSSLKFKVSRATVEIFDLNGRKLLEKQIPAHPAGGPKGAKEFTVDVSHLNSGLYFCRLRTEKGSVTKKLIIQK